MKGVMRCESADPLEPLSFQEIDAYVGRKYSGAGMRKLHGMEHLSLQSGNMNQNCRVAINIPALHTERSLGRTLDLYAQQDALETGRPFEIDVLVNGPVGVNLENSAAYADAYEAQDRSPVPINLYTAQYPAQERQIGRMRRDLATLTIRRALSSGHESPSDLVLVTNDADARQIAPQYVSTIADAFESDPALAGATGFIDLPREDFESDHVLLATQRVSQMLEMVYRAKHPLHPMTMRGGSSAFRVRDYVRAGGHGTARISEHRHLNLTMNKTPGLHLRLLPRCLTTIVTDARRQLATMATGRPVSASYSKFGLPGDVAELYHGQDEITTMPESPRADAAEYVDALTVQLRAMVEKFLMLHASTPWEDIREWFRRAAFFAGMRISFDDKRVPTVTDADVLRRTVLAGFSAPELAETLV